MAESTSLRIGPLRIGLFVVALGVAYGCSGMNPGCLPSKGGGYTCSFSDDAPEPHTRSPYQPPRSDELHEVARGYPVVGRVRLGPDE